MGLAPCIGYTVSPEVPRASPCHSALILDEQLCVLGVCSHPVGHFKAEFLDAGDMRFHVNMCDG